LKSDQRIYSTQVKFLFPHVSYYVNAQRRNYLYKPRTSNPPDLFRRISRVSASSEQNYHRQPFRLDKRPEQVRDGDPE